MLVEKSKHLDMIKVLGGSTVNVGGDGTNRKVSDEGQGSQKWQKKRTVVTMPMMVVPMGE